MIPYADFPYFQMLVYLLVPSLVLGLFGLLNRGWKTVMIGGLLVAHFSSMHALRPGTEVRELLAEARAAKMGLRRERLRPLEIPDQNPAATGRPNRQSNWNERSWSPAHVPSRHPPTVLRLMRF